MKKAQMNKRPSFELEKKLIQNGTRYVFGIDEVGRGSFAGPLVAAAVSFEKEFKWFKNLNDSKLLTTKKREKLSKLIIKHSKYFIEEINVDTINKIGVGKANKVIFEKLIKNVSKLGSKNIHFLIDGNDKKIKNKKLQFIIKGDRKIISIAASSIVAKVYRDKIMDDLGKTYQGYNFSKNKGYGTKFHQKAIKKLGLTKIHRKSFNLRKYT